MKQRREGISVGMESTGLRASQMCMGWALAVVSEARRNGQLEKPEGVTLGDKLLKIKIAPLPANSTKADEEHRRPPPAGAAVVEANGSKAESQCIRPLFEKGLLSPRLRRVGENRGGSHE